MYHYKICLGTEKVKIKIIFSYNYYYYYLQVVTSYIVYISKILIHYIVLHLASVYKQYKEFKKTNVDLQSVIFSTPLSIRVRLKKLLQCDEHEGCICSMQSYTLCTLCIVFGYFLCSTFLHFPLINILVNLEKLQVLYQVLVQVYSNYTTISQ